MATLNFSVVGKDISGSSTIKGLSNDIGKLKSKKIVIDVVVKDNKLANSALKGIKSWSDVGAAAVAAGKKAGEAGRTADEGIGRIGRSGTAVANTFRNVGSGLGKMADQSEAGLKRVGSAVGKTLTAPVRLASDAVGVFGLNASTAFAAAGGAALFMGVKFNASQESATVAFTTMLGSAQKAKQMMADLTAFAAKTPFDLPGVTSAAQRLLAFGFSADQVLPTLTAIGDAVSGLGGGAEQINQVTVAIGQMAAKGKIQSDEILQLTEAGVPALRILANEYHVTTGKMQEMITKGVVPSSVAIPRLLEGIEKGTKGAAGNTQAFAGMMKAQSKTMTGVWSNFKDNFNKAMGNLVKPAMPALKAGLGWLTTQLGKLPEYFQRAKDLIAPVLAKVAPVFRQFGQFITNYVLPALANLWKFIKPVAEYAGGILFIALKGMGTILTKVVGPALVWVSGILKPLAPVIIAIAAGFLAWRAIGVLVLIIRNVAGSLGLVMKAWRLLSIAFATSPIGFIISVIIGLVAGFIYLWKTSASFRNFWIGLWNAIKAIVSATVNWIRGAFNSVVGFFRKWGLVVLAVIAPFIGLPLLIISHWRGISGFFVGIWHAVAGWFSRLRIDVITHLQNLWAGAVGIFNRIKNWIINTAVGIWRNVTGYFSRLWHDTVTAFVNLWGNTVNLWNRIKGWIVNTAIGIWHQVTGFFGNLRAGIANHLNGIWQGAVNIWNRIKGWIVNTAQDIGQKVINAFGKMRDTLTAVWHGIVNRVFVDPVNFVINVVINKGINTLLQKIGSVFGQKWSVNVRPIGRFAQGGMVPGSGNRDSVLAAVMPGEGIITKRRMRELGGKRAIDAINGGGRTGPTFSGGGEVPHYGLGGWISNLVGDVGGAIKSGFANAVSWVRGATANVAQGLLNASIYPLADKASGTGLFGKMPHNVAHKVGDGLVSWLRGKDAADQKAMGPGGPIPFHGGRGVTQWAPLVLRALAALGQPASWLGTVLRRMNQESGGNPNAINNWDSNARRGTPSIGLMQTIGPTFNAYKPPGAKSIYDPYSNIFAGMNYAIHRYGSLAGMNRPGGYANGAVFNHPTWGLLGEQGTEVLLPVSRPGRTRNLMARAGIGSVGGGGATTDTHHNYLIITAKNMTVEDLERLFREMERKNGGP